MPSSAATVSDCAAAKPKPIRSSVARAGAEGFSAAAFVETASRSAASV